VLLSEVFRRHRTIYLLAVGHALVALSLAVSVPESILHDMHVGIGYIRYRPWTRAGAPSQAAVTRYTGVIRTWLICLIACTAVVAISFTRIDVPLALHLRDANRFLSPLNEAFGTAIILSAESAVVLALVLARLVRGHISLLAENVAIACLSSICAYGINSHVLKVFFGVPDPIAVMHGAGHAFHLWAGEETSSFPSGHMVLAGAFAGVFMRLYKITIWPLAALLLVAAGLLVAGGWHFLSDVIAGAFLGLSAGMLAGEGRAAHLATLR